jgi:anaphase-promoting complex subunit 8
MEISQNMEDVPEIKLDLVNIKKEISRVLQGCTERGLLHTSKWLAEINHAIRPDGSEDKMSESSDLSGPFEPNSTSDLSGAEPRHTSDLTGASIPVLPRACSSSDLPGAGPELDTYQLGKSYFDLKEYDRAAFFTKSLTFHQGRFLHFYCRYLSSEKKRLDDMTDTSNSPDTIQLPKLRQLRVELEKLYATKDLDAYTLYIYGVVLRKLSLVDLAVPVLCESIQREPMHWGSWQELSCLVTSREKLLALDLPDHWIRNLFTAHTYLELQQNDEALQLYFGLINAGLQDSTYIMAQVAIAFHNMRQVDQAVDYFKQLGEIDPFRLDNMDTYSNLLYVKEQRVELAHLAHRTNQIDKYRTETCCVIGNYYSLSSQHEKAAQYFQRALKLNPGYLSALTLMGHEYMEMKNTTAAIHSYRQAIEVNRRDYRAWYGLGQTYELLKMPYYCLYYYKQAQELRPSDSRMLVALGESYERLDKIPDAMKCFWKAHCVGDIEGGIALLKLAKLYEQINDVEQAAAAYSQYIQETERQGIPERDEQGSAFKFLADYYLKRDLLDEAYEFAMKCLQLADVLEAGKALIKEISNKRGKTEGASITVMEDQASFVSSRIRPLNPNDTSVRDVEPVSLSFNNT